MGWALQLQNDLDTEHCMSELFYMYAAEPPFSDHFVKTSNLILIYVYVLSSQNCLA